MKKSKIPVLIIILIMALALLLKRCGGDTKTNGFIPVKDITGVPVTARMFIPLTLSGTAETQSNILRRFCGYPPDGVSSPA